MSQKALLNDPDLIVESQDSIRADLRSIRSLVILGMTSHMAAFADRVKLGGIQIHAIELISRPGKFKRQFKVAEPGGICMEWSEVGTVDGLARVKAFAEKVKADAVLSSDDWVLTWLGKNRSQFEPGCNVLAPDPSTLERLWDKAYQVGLAKRCGFDVLPSYSIMAKEDIAAIPEETFPAVIRPSYPSSASPTFKAVVLASRDELTSLYEATRWTHPPIVQRFCLGPNLVLHGVRAQTGEFLGLRLFNVYRKYHGFSTSMEPLPLPAELESAARRFIQEAGLIGPFHFELLTSDKDGKSYFLEINCRLGGTTGKVVMLGFDEPGLLLAAFNTQPAKPLPPLSSHRRATSLRLNLLQAWDELRNQRDPIAYPQLPRFQSLFSALKEALLVPKG